MTPVRATPDLGPADVSARVDQCREVADGVHLTRLEARGVAATARPGQFVQLRTRPRDGFSPFLRLPLSVAAVDRDAGTFDVLYEEVGPKTRALWRCEPGAEVGCLGPLGNAFVPPTEGGDALLVGGGIGVPPLLFFGHELRAAGGDPILLVGARTAGKHLPDDIVGAGARQALRATDDGTLGHAGLVTDLLTRRLATGPVVTVYTCGPHGMMAAVARECARRGVACQASLEAYMACGFGVCVGCVVERADGGAADGPYARYSRVCVEGPVYDAMRIAW